LASGFELLPNEKQPRVSFSDGLFEFQVGATGFEPRVALYLLRYPALVESTEATSDQSTSVSSDRSAQDRSQAKPDEVVQTPVARLSGRAASRATNAYAVRAAEIVLTH
jgi:hypothetical protein